MGSADANVGQFSGSITGERTTVTDPSAVGELHASGYGELTDGVLVLDAHEALYLIYSKNLKVMRRGRAVSFDAYMRHARTQNADALVRFLIYRDLRARGYTVRNGFGFGSDFCVYERGDYGKKGAKYLVFGFSDGTSESAGVLHKKVDEITQMGKVPIVAVVDGRGEIIYYKISPAAFAGVTDAERDLL